MTQPYSKFCLVCGDPIFESRAHYCKAIVPHYIEPSVSIPISLLFDIYCELVHAGCEDLVKELKNIVKGEK